MNQVMMFARLSADPFYRYCKLLGVLHSDGSYVYQFDTELPCRPEVLDV